MKIGRMTDLDGASKYGTCAECKNGVTADENALKITLESGASVILCEKCWKKLTHILDEIDFNDVLKILKKQEDEDE